MKRALLCFFVLLVCLCVCAAAGWTVYTMVAVDGAGAAPHVPVIAGAFGIFGIAALTIHIALAAIRADDAPRPDGRCPDRMRDG